MLSLRLRKIHDAVTPGARVADIGCDHARLAIALRKSGRATSVIAGDVARGPVLHAQRNIADELADGIEVRLGYGLDVIKPGEVDTVILAGMGATLMSTILQRGKDRLRGVKQLLLQPAAEAEPVRCRLLRDGWGLTREDIFEEAGFYYEFLEATPGNSRGAYHLNDFSLDLQCVFGPLLLKQMSPVFMERWRDGLPALQQIVKQMQSSRDPRTEVKRKRYQERIALLQNLLNI